MYQTATDFCSKVNPQNLLNVSGEEEGTSVMTLFIQTCDSSFRVA